MSNLSIKYSTRTAWVKLRFGRFWSRERVRNVRLSAKHYHLCYVLSTQRWVSVTETVIIPGKISILPSQVPLNWQKQNATGVSALWDPEEGLEKQNKTQIQFTTIHLQYVVRTIKM